MHVKHDATPLGHPGNSDLRYNQGHNIVAIVATILYYCALVHQNLHKTVRGDVGE